MTLIVENLGWYDFEKRKGRVNRDTCSPVRGTKKPHAKCTMATLKGTRCIVEEGKNRGSLLGRSLNFATKPAGRERVNAPRWRERGCGRETQRITRGVLPTMQLESIRRPR